LATAAATTGGHARAHLGYTAAKLMTAPAITVHPEATISAAARLLNDHHIRRLPVVDPSGTLIGIVSRRDLLSVFLRPDSEIAEEARQVVAPLLGGPPQVTVRVRSGIITLSGQPERRDLVPMALGLIADIDGVVTVLTKISLPARAGEPAGSRYRLRRDGLIAVARNCFRCRPGGEWRRDARRQASSRMQITPRQAPKMTHGASTTRSPPVMRAALGCQYS
jgi:hypothetical protein